MKKNEETDPNLIKNKNSYYIEGFNIPNFSPPTFMYYIDNQSILIGFKSKYILFNFTVAMQEVTFIFFFIFF